MRIALDSSRIRFDISKEFEINEIYSDKYLESECRNDLDDFKANLNENSSYISIYIDNELSGLFNCVRVSTLEMEAHFALKEGYIYMAREVCFNFVKWVFSTTNFIRITAFVADDRRSFVNLLLKIGFKYEGFMNKCLIRKGVIYGKHVLGVTK